MEKRKKMQTLNMLNVKLVCFPHKRLESEYKFSDMLKFVDNYLVFNNYSDALDEKLKRQLRSRIYNPLTIQMKNVIIRKALEYKLSGMMKVDFYAPSNDDFLSFIFFDKDLKISLLIKLQRPLRIQLHQKLFIPVKNQLLDIFLNKTR